MEGEEIRNLGKISGLTDEMEKSPVSVEFGKDSNDRGST